MSAVKGSGLGDFDGDGFVKPGTAKATLDTDFRKPHGTIAADLSLQELQQEGEQGDVEDEEQSQAPPLVTVFGQGGARVNEAEDEGDALVRTREACCLTASHPDPRAPLSARP